MDRRPPGRPRSDHSREATRVVGYPLAFQDWPKADAPALNPSTGWQTAVDRCYDGDTPFVFVHIRAFDVTLHVGVRIRGLWAPELHQEGGPEARDDLARLIPRDTKLFLHVTGWSFARVAGDLFDLDGNLIAPHILANQETGLIKRSRVVRLKRADILADPFKDAA